MASPRSEAMWSFLAPRNLLDFQREAKLLRLEQQIIEDHRAGYDVDWLLDEWAARLADLRAGPVA
jgi:hypothetical protein